MSAATKIWIGLVISAVLLVAFVLTADPGRMIDALSGANYLYLAPAIALYLISMVFRTIRWQVMLNHMKPIRFSRLYPVVVVGYMANNLLPMRLGELVRSYYVGEREGISKTSALATILVERVLDALTLLLFILAIALFVPLTGLAESFSERLGVPWPLLVIAMSAPFAAAFGALLLLAMFPTGTQAIAFALARHLPSRFEAGVRDLIVLFLNGLIPLRSPRTLALLLLLSSPIWLFESALFFVIGFSFDLNLVYDNLGDMAVASVLVTAISNIASSVPAAPGGVGLFELVVRETLVRIPLASVERSVASGFAAVVHAALLLPMVLLGQLFLWAQHRSLRALTSQGQRQAEDRAQTGHREPPVAPAAVSADVDEPQ